MMKAPSAGYTGSLATNYIAARGITDSGHIAALNTLEAALFSAGLINADGSSNGKLKSLYLYGWTNFSAAEHKFNFLNPVDSDSAFRDTYYGGLTHNSSGITGNGVDGYIDSHFKHSDFPGQNNAHIMTYCRNNFADGSYALYGAVDNSFLGTRHLPKLSSTSYKSIYGSTGGGDANTDASGLWIHSRTGASAEVMYRNGATRWTLNRPSSATGSTASILDLAVDYDNGSLKYQNAPANICAKGRGGGLTSTEAAAYSAALNAYFTSAGLNIY